MASDRALKLLAALAAQSGDALFEVAQCAAASAAEAAASLDGVLSGMNGTWPQCLLSQRLVCQKAPLQA